MRVKDEAKQEAIIKATISLINKTGFDSASVSKIAKQAGVSPATIYIYHKNKEDLIISAYFQVKKKVGEHILKDFDPSLPIRDIFEKVWQNLFQYAAENNDEFQFKEQFAHSPYIDLIDIDDSDGYFAPLLDVIERGVNEKIIKNVDHDILSVFIFCPIMILANPRLFRKFELTEKSLDAAYKMAWDAIKF